MAQPTQAALVPHAHVHKIKRKESGEKITIPLSTHSKNSSIVRARRTYRFLQPTTFAFFSHSTPPLDAPAPPDSA
jgi:hypothetical protein